MSISFPFKEYKSGFFAKVKRPVAQVDFQHQIHRTWQPIEMLVDTGADYTLLPQFLATVLGISLRHDCKTITTKGVGGKGKVFMLKKTIKIRLGPIYLDVPIGFLEDDSIPPLLGRQDFSEKLKVTFENFTTTFD